MEEILIEEYNYPLPDERSTKYDDLIKNSTYYKFFHHFHHF